MLVGIMSDSHGDAAATAQAVALLLERGAEKLFHCGDIGGVEVLSELTRHDCVWAWGNCDEPSASLQRYVAALGSPWPGSQVRVEICGKRIAVCHGHKGELATVIRERNIGYIFYGHTHRLADHRQGSCRLINPGALHRVSIKTVATLDVRTDDLHFWRVDTGEEVRPRR